VVSVPLGKTDWRRGVAEEAQILVQNRYFEQNPTNLEDGAALLSRPGMKRLLEIGDGPVRATYSQPGSFDDALFAVAGEALVQIETDLTWEVRGSGIFGNVSKSTPSMAATARIGSVPEYLYIADGRNLWVYTENDNARGRLASSGFIANGVQVRIDDVYYQWTTGSVDTGTPLGTSGAPWLVARGADNTSAFSNLLDAINQMGIEGETYSTGLEEHPTVHANIYSSTELYVMAKAYGAGGNTIATTIPSGSLVAWDDTTLEGGGTPRMSPVAVPDDAPAVSVGYIAGYIIVVIGQSANNGRFYWIKPGETTIDPLDFATAERAPDPLISVRVVGDQFWLLGTNSTEVWYPTGQADAPFLRVQGRLFDSGVWEGTDAQIRDSVMVVDSDGIVYQIVGGGPQRVSNNSIEERIRLAMNKQVKNSLVEE
jgi:hypothetical protein